MSFPYNQIINGAFQDIQGNTLSNGYLLFELNQDAVFDTATLVCSGSILKILLDENGNVPFVPNIYLYINSILTPSDTFYYVSAYSSSGQLVWGPFPQIIPASPNPFDLGTWVPGDI